MPGRSEGGWFDWVVEADASGCCACCLKVLELRHERVDRTKLGMREVSHVEQVRKALVPVVKGQNGNRAIRKQGRHHDAHDVRDFLIDEFHFTPPENRPYLIFGYVLPL